MNIPVTYQRIEERVMRRSLKLFFTLLYRKRHARLSLERTEGLDLLVPPEVFNPMLFGSSLFLARYLRTVPLSEGGQALDLGCGSGILGLVLAQRGARVIAIDINPQAVWAATTNAHLNALTQRYEARCGGLYTPVAQERFDLIVMNPPYYARTPHSPLDHAFFAGEEYAVLRGMISGAGQHLREGGRALAVLSSTVPLAQIILAAQEGGLAWRVAARRRYWAEDHIIYEFRPQP